MISEWLGKGSEINQGLLICESKGVTAKMLQAEIIKLKKERYLQWHQLHPENNKINDTRSVYLVLLEMKTILSPRRQHSSFSPTESLSEADALLRSIRSTSHLMFSSSLFIPGRGRVE